MPEPPFPTLTLRPLALLGLAGGAIIAAVLLSKREDAANDDEERPQPPKDLGWLHTVPRAALPSSRRRAVPATAATASTP